MYFWHNLQKLLIDIYDPQSFDITTQIFTQSYYPLAYTVVQCIDEDRTALESVFAIDTFRQAEHAYAP
jgi:hypothetical protein